MANFNKVLLLGNLTRDPEVRYTPKGSAVAELGIACNRTYGSDTGERLQETTYVEIIAWSKLAEICGQYLRKGSSIFIEGRLQQDTWDDKATGQKRSKLRVVAENIQFLSQRSTAAAPADSTVRTPATHSESTHAADVMGDDEIPF